MSAPDLLAFRVNLGLGSSWVVNKKKLTNFNKQLTIFPCEAGPRKVKKVLSGRKIMPGRGWRHQNVSDSRYPACVYGWSALCDRSSVHCVTAWGRVSRGAPFAQGLKMLPKCQLSSWSPWDTILVPWRVYLCTYVHRQTGTSSFFPGL